MTVYSSEETARKVERSNLNPVFLLVSNSSFSFIFVHTLGSFLFVFFIYIYIYIYIYKKIKKDSRAASL